MLDLQERDAEAGQQGEDFRSWETVGSVRSQTNSSSCTRLNAFKKRNRALEAKIDADKERLQETSERIRSLIMTEFPTIFQEPYELPTTRWEEHVIDLESGARMPPVRGLPHLSPLELEETKMWEWALLWAHALVSFSLSRSPTAGCEVCAISEV